MRTYVRMLSCHKHIYACKALEGLSVNMCILCYFQEPEYQPWKTCTKVHIDGVNPFLIKPEVFRSRNYRPPPRSAKNGESRLAVKRVCKSATPRDQPPEGKDCPVSTRASNPSLSAPTTKDAGKKLEDALEVRALSPPIPIKFKFEHNMKSSQYISQYR